MLPQAIAYKNSKMESSMIKYFFYFILAVAFMMVSTIPVHSLAKTDRLEIVPDWGYPATESPFAGVLKHTDTGNSPPMTPSFANGWNQSGSAHGFGLYEPHKLASVFPTGLQDSVVNNLGFLNLTYPVLLNVPPLDFSVIPWKFLILAICIFG